MKNIIVMTIIFSAAITVIVVLLAYSEARAEALMQTSDCVVETAKAEDYRGNPYSKEAWEIFAPHCV